jgi:hypothetical protein
LNIHARFASTGSMMRIDDASEIVGVSPSAITSSIASVAGVVLVPMIASTWFSPSSFFVACTAVVVSDASSSTMYSMLLPPIVFAHIATVFFSGMPRDAAGPVADTTTPIFTCAITAPVAAKNAASAAARFHPCFIGSSIFSRRREGREAPASSSHSGRHDSGCARPARRSRDAGRQVQEAAEPCAPAARRRAIERVIGEPREEARQRNARLEPREVHPGARMDAGPEREVPVRVARQHEGVGRPELRGIAVRRADAKRDPRVRWQGRPAHDGFARGDPVAELVRALEAEELLHRDADDVGVGRCAPSAARGRRAIRPARAARCR